MPTINAEHNNFDSLCLCIDTAAEPAIVNAAPRVCCIDLPHFNTDYKLNQQLKMSAHVESA